MLFFLSAIIVVPLSFQIGSIAPTPTTLQHKRLIHDWTPFLAICLIILQCSIWCHAVIEVLLVAAPASTVECIAGAMILRSGNNLNVYMSGGRLLGCVFCITGAALRWLCYQEMAHQFTFHITVMKNHKLVTCGPYAYVRHPSYTGGLLLDLGVLIWHLAPGSWLRESSNLGTAMFWILAAPSVILMCFSTRMHFWRCEVEDGIMRKQFGKQWDEWANTVPYKLLPGVY